MLVKALALIGSSASEAVAEDERQLVVWNPDIDTSVGHVDVLSAVQVVIVFYVVVKRIIERKFGILLCNEVTVCK